MRRENVSDLLAFLAVARERSFTKAGKKLGISQSALSHTIRGLEERLGIRLLTRTTRSVSPTDAGNRLLASVGSPSYFEKQTLPKKPQDLTEHNCINLRLPIHGGLFAWELEKGGRELRVRVEGQLVFNATGQILNAALGGL